MNIMKDWMMIPIQKKANVGIVLCIIGILLSLYLIDGFWFHHTGYVKGVEVTDLKHRDDYKHGFLDGVASVPPSPVTTNNKTSAKPQIHTVYITVKDTTHAETAVDSTLIFKQGYVKAKAKAVWSQRLLSMEIDSHITPDSIEHTTVIPFVVPPKVIKETKIEKKTNWTAVWMSDVITAGILVFAHEKIKH